MNKTLIALALAAAIPVVYATAGSSESGHRDHGARWERMAEKLDLSDEQRTQMRTLFEGHRAEREAMRERMRTEMAEVLSPEQIQRLEQMRAERTARHAKGAHHGKGRHGKGHHRGSCAEEQEASS